MSDSSELQLKFMFITVIIGIVAVLIVFFVTVNAFEGTENPAETIVAVLGAVTGVIGTLVGYVAGQSGKEKAVQRASKAERQLTAVVDQCGEGILERAKKVNPLVFIDYGGIAKQ